MMFVLYQNSERRWLWRLVSARGRILAYGAKAFESKDDCRADIQLVKDCREARVHVKPLLSVIN